MNMTDWLGIGIPVAYALMMKVESLKPARHFPTRDNWRLTGAVFFAMVLLIGALLPKVLPLENWHTNSVFNLTQRGLWGVPIGLGFVTFVNYWLHRAEHRFNWLWKASHQLHHSAVRIDVAGAFFVHPIEVFLKVLISVLICTGFLGLSGLASAAVSTIGAVVSIWTHMNIQTPHWLGYWLVRPEMHVLHHERGVHARNYGDLPFWDMLFGTFLNPLTSPTKAVGFDDTSDQRKIAMLLMQDVNNPASKPK